MTKLRRGSTPRQFQFDTQAVILGSGDSDGSDVILQAPTGSGKTRAVILPALKGFERDAHGFPQKLIYGAPMRTLVSSQVEEMRHVSKRKSKWRDNDWKPSIQTGEHPDDSMFEGKLVFATVDQMLASFLNVPYNVPKRWDNINAGAFVGSYLIFDEFHLYPTKEMLLSVLAMCRMLKGISRFSLMTATFSRDLLDAIGTALDAAVIADDPGVPVTDGLFSDIEHLRTQQRIWQAADGAIGDDQIRDALADHQTVLCIVNQVDRSQQIYRDLTDGGLPADVDVSLLHSRFYQQDRTRKEKDEVTKWLGKRALGTPPADGRRKIIIATQVVEVGLDISADILLTECAPAASLIQRAGRCARWGGPGIVQVFQPPNHSGDHKHFPEKPNYAPYEADGLRDVCERTWEALTSSDFDGRVLRYHDEQNLINHAHSAHDREYLIDGLEQRIEKRIDLMTDCMRNRDEGLITRLIREQSGVPLYVMRSLNDEVLTEKSYELESFNVTQGRIYRAYQEMIDYKIEADFYFAAGNEQPADDSDDTQTRTITKWQALHSPNDVYSEYRFVAHPEAVAYDPEIGLEWVNQTGAPAKSSPTKLRRTYTRITYNRDTLAEHVAGLRRVYDVKKGITRKHPILRDEYAYALTRVAAKLDPEVTFDELDRYIRLMIALHDVGKLNRPWQQWAEAHQRLFGTYNETGGEWDGTPLAHTDTDFANPTDHEPFKKEFAKRYKQPRGPHAVESAEAARPLLEYVTGDIGLWFNIITVAICHHHTPTANTCGGFEMTEGGYEALVDSLHVCGFEAEAVNWATKVQADFDESDMDVEDAWGEVAPRRNRYTPALMYYLFVRILRLADQRSFDYLPT